VPEVRALVGGADGEDGCASYARGHGFAVICASDRLDLHKAADALAVSRHQLRVGSEADMAADFPAYEVGAIRPLRSIGTKSHDKG
jgi:prolyl-tRNA editing enzyme YbaK/EbsC (Cys-tRNA(Pro) deacylase)